MLRPTLATRSRMKYIDSIVFKEKKPYCSFNLMEYSHRFFDTNRKSQGLNLVPSVFPLVDWRGGTAGLTGQRKKRPGNKVDKAREQRDKELVATLLKPLV